MTDTDQLAAWVRVQLVVHARRLEALANQPYKDRVRTLAHIQTHLETIAAELRQHLLPHLDGLERDGLTPPWERD